MKTIYSKDKYSKIHEYIVKKPSEYLSSIIYSVIFERKGVWGSFILFKIKYLFFLTLLLFNKKKLFNLFVKKTTKIDWDIINAELKRFNKRKNFTNYIVNKHYL